MKKIRKTKLLGVILCGLITSFMVTSVYKSIDPVFAQDESQSDGRLVFINGGLISLSGRIVLCGEGDSVVITVVLAAVFLNEQFTWKSAIGSLLITAGTIFMVM